MDSVVPSYLDIGGVAFPLMLGGGDGSPPWVNISAPPAELIPLTYVTWETVTASQRDTPVEVLARDGFHQQELVMTPLDTSRTSAFAVHMMHWRRLSGAWPDPEECLVVETGFAKTDLALPRTVFVSLIVRMRELRDGIESGRIARRLSDAPVPPPRAATAELEEFDFLWGIDKEDAKRFARELYERRG